MYAWTICFVRFQFFRLFWYCGTISGVLYNSDYRLGTAPSIEVVASVGGRCARTLGGDGSAQLPNLVALDCVRYKGDAQAPCIVFAMARGKAQASGVRPELTGTQAHRRAADMQPRAPSRGMLTGSDTAVTQCASCAMTILDFGRDSVPGCPHGPQEEKEGACRW